MYSKFCVGCGAEFNINHKFCGKCGKKREQIDLEDRKETLREFDSPYRSEIDDTSRSQRGSLPSQNDMTDKSTLPEKIEMKKFSPLFGEDVELPITVVKEKERGQAKIIGVILLIICAGAFVVPISEIGTFYDESIRCAQHPETISNVEVCENRWIYMIGVYIVGIAGGICLINGFRKS